MQSKISIVSDHSILNICLVWLIEIILIKYEIGLMIW